MKKMQLYQQNKIVVIFVGLKTKTLQVFDNK